jgi:hypothetical protein
MVMVLLEAVHEMLKLIKKDWCYPGQ